MSPNIQKSSAKAFPNYDFENELFINKMQIVHWLFTKPFVHEGRLYSSTFR